MRHRWANVALTFAIYLVLFVGGSALLPDGVFQQWGWPLIVAIATASLYVGLDRRRTRTIMTGEIERHLREHKD